MEPETSSGDDAIGILTPAEQRVLEFVQAGTIDAEIAVRLGVHVGEVKTRIEAMCAKLGLADRAALAAWRPGMPAASAPLACRSAGSGADAPPPAPAVHQHHPHLTWHLSRGTLLNLAVVVAIATSVLAYFLTQDGSEAGAPAVEDLSPTATATQPPTPAMLAGKEVPFVRVLDPAPLPAGVSVLAVHHDPAGNARLVRISNGRVDVVFDPRTGLQAQASPDGKEILVVTCEGQGCDAASGAAANARSLLLRSVDGGTTWTPVADFEARYTLLDFEGGKAVLVERSATRVRYYAYDIAAAELTEIPGPEADVTFDGRQWNLGDIPLMWLPSTTQAVNALPYEAGAAIINWLQMPKGGTQSPATFVADVRGGELGSVVAIQEGLVRPAAVLGPGLVLGDATTAAGVGIALLSLEAATLQPIALDLPGVLTVVAVVR